jgi:hypothetical protein
MTRIGPSTHLPPDHLDTKVQGDNGKTSFFVHGPGPNGTYRRFARGVFAAKKNFQNLPPEMRLDLLRQRARFLVSWARDARDGRLGQMRTYLKEELSKMLGWHEEALKTPPQRAAGKHSVTQVRTDVFKYEGPNGTLREFDFAQSRAAKALKDLPGL